MFVCKMTSPLTPKFLGIRQCKILPYVLNSQALSPLSILTIFKIIECLGYFISVKEKKERINFPSNRFYSKDA